MDELTTFRSSGLPALVVECFVDCAPNAIESLNMSLRKAIKNRGAFPSEEAALKVLYLALRNLARKWETVQGWRDALNRFALVWQDRFPHQGL